MIYHAYGVRYVTFTFCMGCFIFDMYYMVCGCAFLNRHWSTFRVFVQADSHIRSV